jgi:hypothetical protein
MRLTIDLSYVASMVGAGWIAASQHAMIRRYGATNMLSSGSSSAHHRRVAVFSDCDAPANPERLHRVCCQQRNGISPGEPF